MQFMKQSDLEKLWFSKWVYPKALSVDTTLVFTIKISWWKVFFGGGSYLRILIFFWQVMSFAYRDFKFLFYA